MFRANNIGVLILNCVVLEFSKFDDGILEQVGTVCHLQSNNPQI